MFFLLFLILTSTLAQEPVSYVFPGRGYSSLTGDLAQFSCFTPSKISFGKIKSMLIFEAGLTNQQARELIGASLTASVGVEKFKGEGSLQYINSMNETEVAFSIHYIFRMSRQVYFEYPFQVNEFLTADGNDIYGYGSEMFRQMCGDTYVKSYEDGAFIIYSYTFTFGSKTEKESFQAKASLDVGFAKGATAFQDLFDELGIEGGMNIKAEQVGGDPRKLAAIFPEKSVQCMSNDLAACQETIDVLQNYSQAFPEQVNLQQSDPAGTPIGPYVINYHPFLSQQIELDLPDLISDVVETEDLTPHDFYGKGFSSVMETVAEYACFIPRRTFFGNFKSELQFESWLKTQEAQKMIGATATVDVGVDKYKGSASLEYFKSLKESEVSFSTHFVFKISRQVFFEYPFQVNRYLTEDGKAIYKYGPDLFRRLCGDTYIRSYDDGAYLIFTFSFSFSTRAEKESFEANAGVSIPFASATTAYQQLFDQLGIQGKMEVRAEQVGGNPSNLTSIFPEEVVSCLSNNLAACQKTIDTLHNYSQVFPDQVDLQQNETLGTPIGPYEINSYPFLDIQIDLRDPTP